MKRPTMQDIADEAGVNKCVVSHVLHDDAYAATVRPQTRQRILEIAERIGYRLNSLASAIRTGQVNTIAVIVKFDEWRSIVPLNQIMAGIMMETARRKYGVKVFSDDDLDSTFRSIVENRIEKVISMSLDRPSRDKAAELAEKYSLDLVYAYERGHGKFPAVNVDNAEISAEIVHYLFGKGHSRIGLLCVPHRYHYIEDRHSGYLRGMSECGLKVDPLWISCSDDIGQSLEVMLALPQDERPTALVALSDSVAAKVESYAIRHSWRFPQDISVVGIGDFDIASQLSFPLTTMRESLQTTGQLLVRLLMKEPLAMEPDAFNVFHTHAVLVERESVFDITNQNRRSK